MIKSYIITHCITIVINHTHTWTDYDKTTLANAKNRCYTLYEDAPCLKKFIKKAELTYAAVCGG